MSYVEKHLIEGETIIYETRLHWIVLIAPILLGLLFALTGVAMFVLSATDPGRPRAWPPIHDGHRSGLSRSSRSFLSSEAS